jgi:hypothetical protein
MRSNKENPELRREYVKREGERESRKRERCSDAIDQR